jgi:hypothetical protein
LGALAKKSRNYAVPTAAVKVAELFQKWTQSIHNVLTWRAICRKYGVHTSTGQNEKVQHNWNDDLAEEFTKLLDKDLRRIGSGVLPEIQKGYIKTVEKEMKNLAAQLESLSLNVTKYISNPLTNFLHTVEGLQVEMMREVNSQFEEAINKSRHVYQRVPRRIRKAMTPGYAKAAAIKGISTILYSKNHETLLSLGVASC